MFAYFKRISHSTPVECAKGAIAGELLFFKDPTRYYFLKELRTDRSERKKDLAMLITRLNVKCKEANLDTIKIFGRVKSIGSLDRQEERARLVFPGSEADVVAKDIIGVCIVVKTQEDCYRALEIVRLIGTFIKMKKPNPLDFIANGKIQSLGMPDSNRRDAIHGYIQVPSIPVTVNIRICTKETLNAKHEFRGERIKYIKREISNAKSNLGHL